MINPTGSVGLIGIYFNEDPERKTNTPRRANTCSGSAIWKGVTIGQGQAPVKRYNEYLRDMIIAGRSKPSFIVSHRLPLSQAQEGGLTRGPHS